MSKKKTKIVTPVQGDSPRRGCAPFYRARETITFAKEGLTRQSFKKECDINTIVAAFTKTGVIPRLQQLSPQYGDAPDITAFEAACVTAEVASQIEEGYTPTIEPKEPETAPEEVSVPETPAETTTGRSGP